MGMYTDPLHLKVEDPGHVKGNTVFTYLDAFASDEDFVKYYPEFKNLDELKAAYEHGGIGDVKIKKFLLQILDDFLKPIREKRKYYEEHLDEVYDILKEGTMYAHCLAKETLYEVKNAMKLNYFNNKQLLDEFKNE